MPSPHPPKHTASGGCLRRAHRYRTGIRMPHTQRGSSSHHSPPFSTVAKPDTCQGPVLGLEISFSMCLVFPSPFCYRCSLFPLKFPSPTHESVRELQTIFSRSFSIIKSSHILVTDCRGAISVVSPDRPSAPHRDTWSLRTPSTSTHRSLPLRCHVPLHTTAPIPTSPPPRCHRAVPTSFTPT